MDGKIEKVDYEYAPPNPASLAQSLRAFGYNIRTAVADLIDNSITAGALNIGVEFEWNNGNPWIAVVDDGKGMTPAELLDAMRPGSKDPLENRAKGDLGRFGLGLKTASFSQCKKVTVATKEHSSDLAIRCWDLDLIAKENNWILLKEGSSVVKKRAEIFFKNHDSGTLVFWEKLDRLIPGEHINDEAYQKAFLDYAMDVKRHIAEVFMDFMTGRNKICFTLNGRNIEPWDPFMSDNPFTTRMPEETFFVHGHEVQIKPYILPHQSKLSTEDFIKYAGRDGWTEQQGFYIYRSHRLIVSGDWLISGMQDKEQYKLARIRIDIDNNLDKEWSIDVRKAIAVPPVSIQAEIKRIAKAAQKESSRIYRHRGKQILRNADKNKTFLWHQKIKDGKIGYEINREHPLVKKMLNSDKNNEIRDLLNLIEETVPVPMIISDYSSEADKMLSPFEDKNSAVSESMIESVYNLYLQSGMSSEEALKNMAGTEPFLYVPEKIELFREKKGI